MRTLANALACVVLICAASSALAAQPEEPTRVHVPAGDLNDAVEALGKQTGVGVMYAGDLLDGRTTAGVDGTMLPKEAFARLLQGTPLVVTEERGALRIAKAPSPEPAAAGAQSVDSGFPPATMIDAVWVRREVNTLCHDCDFHGVMEQILERLGATRIFTTPRYAEFHSLAPAGDAARAGELPTTIPAHWETVTFGRPGRWPREDTMGIDHPLYAELRSGVLPSFTTRNLFDNDGQIAVDVLVAGPPPAPSECHRVREGGQVRRYCGSPDQWTGLHVRVGFRCKKTGKPDELCASAAEWASPTTASKGSRP